MNEKNDDQCFDVDKLLEDRKFIDEEITQELKNSSSLRTNSLLLTNFIENILNDCIVILHSSVESRGIPRHRIVKILKEKGYLDSELAKEIEKIFKIRDLFAHTMSLSSIIEQTESKIQEMHTTEIVKNRDHTWDTYVIDEKITAITFEIISKLQDVFDGIYHDEHYDPLELEY